MIEQRPSSDRLAAAFSVALAVALFGWMVAGPRTIGQDYLQPQVWQALTYRFYTSLGLEPMWSPSGGGIPVAGEALGQLHHPPAWLLSRLPGYWTGHGLTLIALKHIILLCGAQWVAYLALRRLSPLPPMVCLVLSVALTYQLRTLDLLRYGPAALIWLGLRAWPLRSRLLALAALFGAALPAYAQLETGFVRRAQRELVLPNNYAELLAAQLERWQKAAVTGDPTGH